MKLKLKKIILGLCISLDGIYVWQESEVLSTQFSMYVHERESGFSPTFAFEGVGPQ